MIVCWWCTFIRV